MNVEGVVLRCWAAALVVTVLCACGGGSKTDAPPADAAPSFSLESTDAVPVPDDLPAPMRSCYECHADVVDEYLEHGMARSLGPVGQPDPGVVVNPISGARYEIVVDERGAWLKGTNKDGGTRIQRLVGRVGAGIFDTSWIGAEVHPFTFEVTGRLFFTPVETIAGHGLELSPFELRPQSAGLDLGLNQGCLTCHTTDRLAALPGAAVSPDGRTVYPSNALGADAFEVLSPITCEACHGDARVHVTMMTGLPGDEDEGLGLRPLRARTPGQQRDVCARCHLQGDARFELIDGRPDAQRPLAGQVPVLVPVRTDDDFRFVGQLERLALSACFRGAPEMTCTTCHDPHQGAARQGTARFDAACKACHAVEVPHTALTVAQVTGAPGRTADGCVDCHVRRSQPFDLPHIRTADHYVRRRIPKPAGSIPHRQFADPGGAVTVFDDGRLAGPLATPAGQRWREGVVAMGLVTMGRPQEAAQGFAAFPPPGTAQAVQPTAPPGLVALETDPSFHHTRGLALMTAGQPQQALAAFSDALSLDPYYAGARMERAKLRILTGDMQGALADTDFVLEAHPKAEKPWNLRTMMALQTGVPALAASALEVSVQHWPSDAAAWHQLAVLYHRLGQPQKARQALERAQQLQPSIPDFDAPSSP